MTENVVIVDTAVGLRLTCSIQGQLLPYFIISLGFTNVVGSLR